MNKRKYTKEELIIKLQEFYKEYGKVPTTRDLKGNKRFPNHETIRAYFGSHKNALIESGLYNLRNDKNLFDRHKYSEDEVIKLTNDFIINNNKIPICSDFNSNNSLPSINVVCNIFGNLNNLLMKTGNDPIYQSMHYWKEEELIGSIKKLYNELGKQPSPREIDKCDYTASYNVYMRNFKSIYELFDKANISYKIHNQFISDKELINTWYELKNKINRVPTLLELSGGDYYISNSIIWRWGSYTEFLSELGEISNYNIYGCKVYKTTNNTSCFSLLELKITQWLEDNNIKFKKDYPYNKILKNDKTNRTLDWIIYYNNNTYYIELFGIVNNEFYTNKAKNKIADFKENKLKLICLYPKEVKNKMPSEIFYFLNNN